MHPPHSVKVFTDFAAERGVTVAKSTPRLGIELMFAFYQSVSPDGCEPYDGDMLLFQWGTYDWGTGENFEIGITRQFVELAQKDDEAISQLSLVYRFEPTEELKSIPAGNRWCDGSSEFDLVREFALSSPQLASVESQMVRSVSITHSYM
jgi:hypothetical protein